MLVHVKRQAKLSPKLFSKKFVSTNMISIAEKKKAKQTTLYQNKVCS